MTAALLSTTEMEQAGCSKTHKKARTNTIRVKVKVRFTPEQATKAQRGSRGIALLFL
jgi:hypothetical protein